MSNTAPPTLVPMPDVATQAPPHRSGALDWVGMNGIDVPVRFDAGDGNEQRCAARVGAFVDLRTPDKRGIHMSRLYVLIDDMQADKPLDASTIEALLHAFVASQDGLAARARIDIDFEFLVRRRALRSDNSGWRAYPVGIEATLGPDGVDIAWRTEVVYSSTCPASAALARQLIQDRFAADFDASVPLDRSRVLAWLGSESGIVATPHAQRSVARLRLRYAHGILANLIAVIDLAERSLGTPVQTAVKREDEQAFARANGGNLMFCEDAVRRLQHALGGHDGLVDFHVRVEHQESLHAHDAVAYASRHADQSLPLAT